MPVTQKTVAALAISLILGLLPVFFLIEQLYANAWHDRAALPDIVPVLHLHTPVVTSGVFLPPVITHDRSFTKHEVLILTGTTRIPAGVTLTLGPGVQVYAHEFAALTIEGSLIIEGTPAQPVVFTTNEAHPANQMWSGLMFMAGSHGHLAYTTIRLASPAVSCLPHSMVTVAHSRLLGGSLGVFAAIDACHISDSHITGRTAIQYFSGNTTLPSLRPSYQHDYPRS